MGMVGGTLKDTLRAGSGSIGRRIACLCRFDRAVVSSTTKEDTPMQFSERVTCTIKEAEAATSISRSKLYVLMEEGKLETTRWPASA